MGTSNTNWVALALAEVIFPSPGAAWGRRVAPAAPARRSWIRRGGGLVASTGSCVQMFSSEGRAARA